MSATNEAEDSQYISHVQATRSDMKGSREELKPRCGHMGERRNVDESMIAETLTDRQRFSAVLCIPVLTAL